ncbi:hypothetical protein O3P69_002572 [Scylla paramamosain]|uniref:Uncharacterized protein n=1 Tax=Scylla paramamosain TaxID=85552 RepID=A0AAW0UMF1_SCYPA
MRTLTITLLAAALLVAMLAVVTEAYPSQLPASVSQADCPTYPFYLCRTPPIPAQPANPANTDCYNFPFYPC